jgi:CubicO group peptidase (beta-lactamase class C family)
VLTIASTLGAFAMSAPSLPIARPDDVGMSAERLARIERALAAEVEAARIPGAVTGVMRGGKLVHLSAVGHRDPVSRAPMTTDALFSIASMTKPMTSVALMMLVEEGRVLLADPVSAYVPELKNPKVDPQLSPDRIVTRAPAREPTIQDILRHTSGYPYADRGPSAAHKAHPGGSVKSMIERTKAETLALLGAAPLVFDPGTNWEYGFSTDICGFVVEAVTGQRLSAVLADRLWTPLGMADASFDLPEAKRGRYAEAFDKDPLSGAVQRVHHAHPHTPQWDSGGGGGLASVSDYMRFAEMLRAGGRFDGRQVLGRGTVKLMTSDHLPPGLGTRIADMLDPAASGYGFGLGFAVRHADGGSPQAGSKGDFYWSGVYGTYFWVDPAEDLGCVFMASAPSLIRLRYRQMLRNLVYQALTA